MRLDGVNAVTVSARRGHLIAMRERLPVYALHESAVNVCVALTASRRHIEFVDGRLGIVRRQNGVSAMAVGTNGSPPGTLFIGAPMHALLVADEGLRGLAARLHEKPLPVAAPAGVRNVFMTDG